MNSLLVLELLHCHPCNKKAEICRQVSLVRHSLQVQTRTASKSHLSCELFHRCFLVFLLVLYFISFFRYIYLPLPARAVGSSHAAWTLQCLIQQGCWALLSPIDVRGRRGRSAPCRRQSLPCRKSAFKESFTFMSCSFLSLKMPLLPARNHGDIWLWNFIQCWKKESYLSLLSLN